MNTLVIYHKNCLDGVCAAFCMKHLFPNATYVAASYNSKVPDVVDKDVYLVDFSYKREVVEEICKYAKRVTLLDHHKSALEDLWDLPSKYANFSLGNSNLNDSGAKIAFNFVNKRKPMVAPKVLSFIEDRDLWKFKYKDTKAVTAGLFSLLDYTIENFEEVIRKYSISKIKTIGNIVSSHHTKLCNEIIASNTRVVPASYFKKGLEGSVAVVNAPYQFASEIGDILKEKFLFVAVYYNSSEDTLKYSLRSKEFDVTEVAQFYNGGGHKNAAGFTTTEIF